MPDVQWHITQNGITEGPISQSELKSRALSGSLKHDDLVWRDGLSDWVQAGKIKGLFRTPPVPPILSVAQTPSSNGTSTARINVISNRQMLAQLHDDIGDTQLLAAEMIRVAVRLNPVNIQIYNFLEIIGQITENTPRHDIARCVSEAMLQIDLNNAAPMLDESLDSISTVGPEIIRRCVSDLLSVWPQSKQVLKHRWLDDPEKEGECLRQQLQRAAQAHRSDLVIIQKHFRQLQEFHPRYDATMTRSGVLDYVLGFAAGFLGGGLGAIGAQVWDDWRGKSDSEFCQVFGNAIDEFSAATLAFTQKTEQEVEKVVVDFLQDLYSFTHGTTLALDTIIETQDITPIFRKLHFADPADKLDEDGMQFFEIVITNLRDQKITARSESNIRTMLGMQ